MTSISELFALQELDLAIAADRAAIEDIAARLDEPEELVEARQLLVQGKEELREAEHQFKESEFAADELKRKIEPVEKKLYQGSVTNPKELADLQADVDSLRRRRSELEDKALAAMDALEQAQQRVAEADRTLGELAEQHGVEREDMGARTGELEAELSKLLPEREAAAGEIDPSFLRLYEILRANKGGRAVGKVVGGACQGCRISLPMNVTQRARAGSDIVQCPSCERILYVI
ncbi:MAG: C4-type zinc ribbon domain-containing protein [Dehalococcoidia bacterium]